MALEFNGANQRIDIADTADFDFKTITVCARIFIDAVNGRGVVCKKTNGAAPNDEQFSLQGAWANTGYGEGLGGLTDRLLFQIRQTGGNFWVVGDDIATPVGSWILVCGIADDANNRIRFYRDAALKNTVNIAGMDLQYNNADLHFGWDGFTSYFDGIKGEIRIYSRVLSIIEQQLIIDSQGTDNIVNGLIGRWLMNEEPYGTAAAGANTVIDISTYGNHGTPVNNPVYWAASVRLVKPIW